MNSGILLWVQERLDATTRERDALKAENERLREALAHVTELLIDSWAAPCEGDPELLMAVLDARALLEKEACDSQS